MSDTNRNSEVPDANGPSDESLLRRFCSGQDDAATDLYVRYAKRLEALAKAQSSRSLAARFDPEDVVQSVFRTFFRRARRGEYDIPPGDELWGLFLVIALNKIRKLGTYHRAAKRDVRLTAGPAQLQQPAAGEQATDEMAYHMLRMVVDDLLQDLPEIQRKMIERRIEGHDIASIASLTERSKRTVERTLQNFRSKLGELIYTDNSEPA